MLESRIRRLKRQLQESRYRLVHMYEKLAAPLYDMKFIATKDVWRMSTNGRNIYFDPDWLTKLGEVELDFMLSHQLMHIYLGHIERPAYYYGDRYHLAADIVANGKLTTFGWKYEKIPHIGKIRCETFIPTYHGSEIESIEAVRYVPIDPSLMEPVKKRQFLIDSDIWWSRTDDNGKAGTIVLDPSDEDPDDLEYNGPTYGGGYYFKKEVFPLSGAGEGESQKSDGKNRNIPRSPQKQDARRAIATLREETQTHDISEEEGGFERYWHITTAKQLDWRNLLNAFVQEEVNDYSFTPPDRRIQSDFFLPDYNVYQETVRDVYFMVDTSGSISNDKLALAYAEIQQALEQFQGTLSGVVGFFDTAVHKPLPFTAIEDIKKLRPFGGGGTDYSCIFEFIQKKYGGCPPTSIVIITDGEGYYPDSSMANNIPVLWLLTEDAEAPWGKSVKI